MDAVTLIPTFNTFYFTPRNLNLRPLHSPLVKFKPFPVPSCLKNASDSLNPSSRSHNRGFRFNPFSILLPILRRIKGFATNYSQRWAELEAEEVLELDQGGAFLENGGIGVALLSITASAKVKISPFIATLAANPTFVSGLVAWMMAQSMKMFLNFFVERKWDFRILFASGGMPSSHSALCTALTTSVAICHGVADSLFPVCLGFSLIVMYDAIGVRRHAGMQAEVIVFSLNC